MQSQYAHRMENLWKVALILIATLTILALVRMFAH